MLRCVPNRQSHCNRALRHASPRPGSSTHVHVQMGLGPVASRSSLASSTPCHSKEVLALSFNSLMTNLSSSGTLWNDLAFWTPFSVRMMCSSHCRLANPDSPTKFRKHHAACRISNAIWMLSISSFSCKRFSSGNHVRTTDPIDYSIRIFNLALALMGCSRTISHQYSLDSSALHRLQPLYHHGLLV